MGMLDGRICIVTGAAGSLGRASALRFVAEGAKVMLVDRDRPRLDAILKSLPEGRATAMLADVTNARATQAYVDATVARWGPIDVLFSNAGISGVIKPVADYIHSRGLKFGLYTDRGPPAPGRGSAPLRFP